MFRLIKLAAYAIAGYAVYEFIQGMRQQELPMGEGRMDRELERALNADHGRAGVLTGSGQGTTTTTEDVGGTAVPHVVGRGVTQ